MATVVRLPGVRCTVRSWQLGDAEGLVRHANNVNVSKQLRDRFPHPYTMSAARAFLEHVVPLRPVTNFTIEVEGTPAGGIGFAAGTDVERFSAEIGYWLGEPFWGRGIVTEALSLVTEYAFVRQNILRLFALPFADNLASSRVLEKAGYVREGLLRSASVKFGRPRDQWMYARINTQWESPASS
jgi:ribosomal-protein-alanine N-acetyltransferase